ncbi:acyl-CoA dehydrogenase family protein [Phenylobacterium montanum]|uniref:Acyl-CoA dehydrogenase family protein n=1 Tax=Phenylobacterium montanum TaxID=2823693 RepID=A0A975IUE1_9CAUL|nr:acyl-CoA dehydrogenase family protein [Caulobacter sp. S6]QUD87708.1 acyl-CoA dehydrogenase family protein [Caulobacter sp. S6]
MADFGADNLEAFRGEARAWLEANYPAELRDPNAQVDEEAVWGGRKYQGSADPISTWRARLAEKGWTTPTWPKEYGGGGLSAAEARVLNQELAKGRYATALASFGVWMLGPVLLEYATEEQKKEHLPRIVRGEIRWCQGYSEPGAGSDLAGLATRCEDKGDHYLVNGSKIWTSYADQADWIFALVRTDTSKKHEGISFLLIDMTTPGVETRPIKLISGSSPFCETFFTDVKVPKGNLVGRLNGGWEIAKRLLQYERQNISGGMGSGGGAGGAAGDLGKIALKYHGADESGRLADSDLRTRITKNRMEMQAFLQTVRRVEAESRASKGPSAATSIIKYAAATMAQERSELMVEALGFQGLGWEGEGYSPEEIVAIRGWLRSKGNSIEGGTSEVNLNVVAKRVLGLLDHQ